MNAAHSYTPQNFFDLFDFAVEIPTTQNRFPSVFSALSVAIR
jgi:hypothetical protein